jgi:hypothetical protein
MREILRLGAIGAAPGNGRRRRAELGSLKPEVEPVVNQFRAVGGLVQDGEPGTEEERISSNHGPCGISPMILALKVGHLAVSTDCFSEARNIVGGDDLLAITNFDRRSQE